MTIEQFIGQGVIHKGYGKGTILSIENGRMEVEFDAKTGKFAFPECFAGAKYLRLVNEAMQAEADSYASSLEAARIKESERLAMEKETARKEQKKKEKAERGERKTPSRDFLSYGDEFLTHADALNDCFGYGFDNYQRAFKRIEGTNFAVWFPSAAKRSQKKYVSTSTSQGWVNIITDEGKTIFEKNDDPLKNTPRDDEDSKVDRFVFAKQNDMTYTFIGLFRPEGNSDYKKVGYKYTRLGTKIDLKALEVVE